MCDVVCISENKKPAMFNSKISRENGEVFPPLPNFEPMVFNRAEIKSQWPTFWHNLEAIDSYRRYPDEPMGLISSRSKLNNSWSETGDGNALVLWLPPVMEPGLLEFSKQVPLQLNLWRLDEAYSEAVFVFNGQGGDEEYTFFLSTLSVERIRYGDAGPYWLPITFVSGDTVVVAGHWIDEVMKFGMGMDLTYQTNNRIKCRIPDEQLIILEATESATPWKDGYYSPQAGQYLTSFTVLEMDESEQSYENCCHLDKQSENVMDDEDSVPF